VFERFLDHTCDEKGVLWLLVRWLSYGPDVDTWQQSGRLQAVAVCGYCRRKGLLSQDRDKAAPGREAQEV